MLSGVRIADNDITVDVAVGLAAVAQQYDTAY